MKIKWLVYYTAHKMKFSIKDFFSKYDQIRSFMLIWSHLLKKSLLLENFIFCVVLLQNATFNYKTRQYNATTSDIYTFSK